MADDISIDELVQAVQAVAALRTTVAKHDELIGTLQAKLSEVERRLEALTKAKKP